MSDTPLAWRKSRRSTGESGNCVEAAVTWRKSGRSAGGNQNCVEAAPLWRKSRRSIAEKQNCVEAAPATQAVAVRDSKDPGGGQLRVSGGAWRRFARTLRDGTI